MLLQPHLLYWRIMLALRPAGGSSVIFTPFCRMLTGKAGLGMLVSHSRKSLCTCAGATGQHSFIFYHHYGLSWSSLAATGRMGCLHHTHTNYASASAKFGSWS